MTVVTVLATVLGATTTGGASFCVDFFFFAGLSSESEEGGVGGLNPASFPFVFVSFVLSVLGEVGLELLLDSFVLVDAGTAAGVGVRVGSGSVLVFFSFDFVLSDSALAGSTGPEDTLADFVLLFDVFVSADAEEAADEEVAEAGDGFGFLVDAVDGRADVEAATETGGVVVPSALGEGRDEEDSFSAAN